MAHNRIRETIAFGKLAVIGVIGVCLIALGRITPNCSAQSWQSVSDSALGATYIVDGKLLYRPARRGTRTIAEGAPKTVPFSFLGVFAMDQTRFSVIGIVVNQTESVSIRCEGAERVMITWQKNHNTAAQNGLTGALAPQLEKLNPKPKKEESPESLDEQPTGFQGNSTEQKPEQKPGNILPEPEFVVFEQQKDKPIRLLIQFKDTIDILEAPTFWHLLLECTSEQRLYLSRLVRRFNHLWSFEALFHRTCNAVTKTAYLSPDQQTVYTKWINDLSSDSFSVREKAESQLRQEGDAAAVYLKTLDRKTLNPEAGYRVYRILSESFPVVQMDQVEDISRLLSDQTWPLSVLLTADNPVFQSFAEKKLQKILKDEYQYDQAASDSIRQTQLNRIRQKTNFPAAKTVPFEVQSEFGKSWVQFCKLAINPEQKNLLVLPELPLSNAAQ